MSEERANYEATNPPNNPYPHAPPVNLRFPSCATTGTKRVLVVEAIVRQHFEGAAWAPEYRLILLASISDYLTDRDVAFFYSAVLQNNQSAMRLVTTPLVEHVKQEFIKLGRQFCAEQLAACLRKKGEHSDEP